MPTRRYKLESRLAPYPSQVWCEVEGYSPEDAAGEHHYRETLVYTFVMPDRLDPSHKGNYEVSLSRVEVDGHGSFLVRSFARRLRRSGGVSPSKKRRRRKIRRD